MKKFIKALSLCLALAMLLTLAACGPTGNSDNTQSNTNNTENKGSANESTEGGKNWTGFHGWLEEDWDSKDIDYQFTGYWDMGDPQYGIAFSFLMNLYKDGSVLVAQYQPGGQDYRYFGSWKLVEDPDGDELDITIAEETNESGELIDHKYSYEVYEEADGGFSFGYDFGIAAGQYFRVANLTGSKNAEYATVDAFKAAAEQGAFVTEMPTEPDEGGETTGDETQGTEAGTEDAVATYTAGDLSLVLFADGTMRVEYPQYSMSRDGFTYELSEDGATLTVTGTPDADAMGAFQQIWDALGGEVWTIDGTTATKAE